MESGPKLHITECVDTVCACVAAIIATLPNQENFIFDHLNFKKIFQVYYIFVNTQELLLLVNSHGEKTCFMLEVCVELNTCVVLQQGTPHAIRSQKMW